MNTLRVVATTVMIVLLVGCGGQGSKEVTETRTVAAQSAAPSTPSGNAPMGMPSMDASQMPPGHPSISPFAWQLPEGWTEAQQTSMRVGNFKIASSPEAECYITVLNGAAGGVEANINRWRGQMSQPDLKPDEIAALPKIELLGQQAPLVEIKGNFAGMGGQAKTGYALLGVVCTFKDESLFVKFVGPEVAVQAEKDHFSALCKSLKERGAASEAAAQESK